MGEVGVTKETVPDGDESKRGSSAPSRRKKRTMMTTKAGSADPIWRTLERELGGREGILRAAMAGSGDKSATFTELLLDPAFRNHSVKDLARKAGLNQADLVDMFKNQKWLETMIVLHQRLPVIMDGAAEDASPSQRPCEECKASGKAESGDNCWVCGGSGYTRQSGDKDKLRFVGEAAGMVGKPQPGTQFNQQIVINQGNQNQSFEEMVRKATVPVVKKQIEGAVDADTETIPKTG